MLSNRKEIKQDLLVEILRIPLSSEIRMLFSSRSKEGTFHTKTL